MQPTSEAPLRRLAAYAASHKIRGRSEDNRSSLLKPFDMLIEALKRCQHPEDPGEIALLRAALKSDIVTFIERMPFEEGRPSIPQVYHYVDLFFDDVLGQMHHDQVSKLLDHTRKLRSAYLTWYSAVAYKQSITGNDAPQASSVGNQP